MTDQSGQPTVLVKRPDGTEVRMTLSELQAMQQGGSAPQTPQAPPPPPAPVQEPVPAPAPEPEPEPTPAPAPTLPAVETDMALATTTPVPNIFVDEAKAAVADAAHQWDREDHRSLLDTPAEDVSAPHVPVSPEVDQRVQHILGACSNCVPRDLLARFEALLTSRVKGVRTDEQFREYLHKPQSEGGLSLSEENAEKITQAMHEAYQLPVEVPAPSAPAPVSAPPSPAAPAPAPRPAPIAQKPLAGKPVLHDVLPPVAPTPPAPAAPLFQKRTIGPVDELAHFDMTELRRIGVSGDALTQALLEKFLTLKNESYLLYLDARDAWYRSPLYTRYLQRGIDAMNAGESLDDALAKDDTPDGPMTRAEYVAVAMLNKEIHV